MGYTHYWRQFRPFTDAEWQKLTAEAKRICAKAQRGLYSGSETLASCATDTREEKMGFRVGFNEPYAWRTFAHPEAAIPMQNQPITLVGPMGEAGTEPQFTRELIALNGVEPDEDYESFALQRAPQPHKDDTKADIAKGLFAFCKTEYRPYDAVVVSILAAAQVIAPDAIKASSDGGPEAIKLMF